MQRRSIWEPVRFEPLRIFYPIAIFGAVLSIGIWIPAVMGLLPAHSYPVELHALGVYVLFVIPAITGFLLTAFPRFTGTSLPSGILTGAGVLFFAMGFLSFLFDNLFLLSFSGGLIITILLLFTVHRIYTSTMPLPYFLTWFILPGLLCGAAGFFIYSFANLQVAGRILGMYSMILFIIPGIGSRIIVLILTPDHKDRHTWRRSIEAATLEPVLVSLAITLSIVINIGEAYNITAMIPPSTGNYLLLAALSYWFLFRFRLLSCATGRAIGYSVQFSLAMLLIGILLKAIFSDQAIHYFHFTFIGGISLLILSVMTRSILAHGKHSFDIEVRSAFLWTAIVFMIIAAFTRATAQWLSEWSYFSHLAYASIAFIVAILIWSWKFIPLLKPAKS